MFQTNICACDAGWACSVRCYLFVMQCERKDYSIVQLLLFLYELSDNSRVFGR